MFVPYATIQNWVEAGGEKAGNQTWTEHLDWALSDFSGYIAATKQYDGPFCILSIVDNRTYKPLAYQVLSRSGSVKAKADPRRPKLSTRRGRHEAAGPISLLQCLDL